MRSRFHPLVLSLLVLSSACEGNVTQLPELIFGQVFEVEGTAVRELRVTLTEPAALEVRYWADESRVLWVTTETATEHQVLLARLEADRSYAYTVTASTPDGRTNEVHDGSFVTGSLPGGLGGEVCVTSGQPTIELLLLTYRSASFEGVVACDAAGRVVWWWETEGRPGSIDVFPNGDFAVLARGSGLFRVSPRGDVVASIAHRTSLYPSTTIWPLRRMAPCWCSDGTGPMWASERSWVTTSLSGTLSQAR